MQSIHRFDGKALEYDRFRERYSPAVVLPILRTTCGLTPEWTVADVGAGTGMLSDVFLANGNRVLAVEPNHDMRERCQRIHDNEPRLIVIEGTAEATGLESSSVDLVTAGRAMHWFDRERAFAEFQRILKPDGWLAIIAFGRTEHGRRENSEFENVLREFSDDHADTHEGYQIYRSLNEYLPRDFHHEEILGTMSLDWESLLGMSLSLSHSPNVDQPRYPAFERSLRFFFDRFEKEGHIELETRYWINIGRFQSA